ncbi:type II toxin-antitoxin system VapC family toxin [Polaromonas sp.]|uniref:type II toxin-antitoxin system VapC family toxin n=1 Tax=Polaromonas sp. TaxID=1869339 RepID=UPI00286A798B|nr:type II toxin-antitoxin system VapC family toxin [Polaromonas sp.]
MSSSQVKSGASPEVLRSVYVDVSVWIALLANEPSSPALARWLEAETSPLMTSRWSVVELASALSIKVRRAELTALQAQDLGERFDALVRGEVSLLPLASVDYDQAAALCRNAASGLRAGDALHLAVAQRARASHLMTLDKVMALNAEKLGLQLLQTV